MEKNTQKKVSGLGDADFRGEPAVLVSVPWCTGLTAFQAETVPGKALFRVERFGEVAAGIKMLVTTEVVIITASDLIQDRKKTLILALHNKYNIIRTYYNPVLLEIQVVWTGVHFLCASEYS